MSLAPGTRLGPHEIVSLLGEGGMGQVYRARDTRLNRDVAIKVLPELFAADADRLARFTREAQVLASLNHPNIAAIYGIEESGSRSPGVPESSTTRALVMELVEGEDLSAIIARGVIALSDALPIARQIADALEAAHELGIVHRDLKPQNIKVRADGTVKVLDFGLAKALDPNVGRGFSRADNGAPEGTPYESPTMTSPAMTRMGMIIGTAAYMAPEQARGKSVDKRADIWSFGVVLYEMLSGRRAFAGDDISITLASVLKEDVAWNALPADLPSPIVRLLRRCLEKDPRRRLRDIGEARLALDERTEPMDTTAPPVVRRTRERFLWAALVVIAAVLTPLALKWLAGAAPAPVVSRFELALPAKTVPKGWPEISPDGRSIAAVVVGDDGIERIWIRPMDAVTFQVLAGTEGASYPFWSPDSRSIAFFAGDTLKKIAATGGPTYVLCPAPRGRGGTWNRDGVVVFSAYANNIERLQQVAEGGSSPEVLTLVPSNVLIQRWPHFLPDGRHFLFHASARPRQAETDGVYVGTLGETGATRIAADLTEARYSDGFLFFVRDRTLMAQPFDATRLALGPADAVVVSSVSGGGNEGGEAFSVSDSGVLVAMPFAATAKSQLKWLDRHGRFIADLGVPANQRGPRISQDGLHVVTFALTALATPSGGALWLTDTKGGPPRRFTFSDGGYVHPVWGTDGRVLFGKATLATGIADLFRQSTNGEASQELLFASRVTKFPQDVSPDGLHLVYSATPTQSTDLLVMSLADKTSSPYVKSGVGGRISPDGRWVAYTSSASGGSEIYLESFPTPGKQFQISTGGGTWPVWNRDGHELFYQAGGKLIAVTVPATGAPSGQATPLFDVPTAPDSGFFRNGEYDVAPDGRFLFNVAVAGQTPIAIVTLSWKSGLKK